MVLISINLARVLWFMRTNDLNPRGLNLTSTFYPALLERYQFTAYPSVKELLASNKENPVEFSGGQFINSKGESVAVRVTEFDEAVVVDTRSSTEDSEAFLKEMLEWSTQYGLSFRPDMVLSKSYLSEVIVRCDASVVVALLPELQTLADKVSAFVASPDGPMPYEPAGFSIAPNTSASSKPAPFIFERAGGASFKENRYFSRAPLHTDDHLQLLDELERILKG